MKRQQQHLAVPALAAIAAVFATAVTLAIAVLLPANATPGTDVELLAARARQGAPIEVAIVPSRIEVIGVRNDKAALNDAERGAGRS